MPSALSHAAVAIAAGVSLAPRGVPNRFWALAVICSILPDADVIAFTFGIPYQHFFGHRGFFHSPFFAMLLSIFITFFFFRDVNLFSTQWFFYFLFFFVLSASHGILDAFTNGGLGIALLSPFSNQRYFFPSTPIVVSPIGIKPFFSQWGWVVVKSEFLWVWLPSLLLAGISTLVRFVAARYR